MTYEEAKMQIQAIPEKIWDQLSEPDREAMEMAFSALQEQEAKAQLSAEGTTSDLISRQAAIDRINKQREHLQPDIYPQDKIGDAAYRICAEFIERLPSAHSEIEERTEEFAQNVPKEDLISRKAAIDAALSAFSRGLLASPDIRKLPSVQPEPQWIPVSERLPEEDNWLGGSGKQFSDNVLVSILNSDDEDEWVDVSQTIDGEWALELPRHCKILAWMSLPEPYRAERRTDEGD